MKCMFVVDCDAISGFPISLGCGRPYVRFGNDQLSLANDLLETNPGTRLLRCDIKAVGAGFELIAEQPHASSDLPEPTLYLCEVSNEYNVPKSSILETQASNGQSRILASRTYMYDQGCSVYHATLAVLYPDASLMMTQGFRVAKPKSSGILGRLMPTFYSLREDIVEVARCPR